MPKNKKKIHIKIVLTIFLFVFLGVSLLGSFTKTAHGYVDGIAEKGTDDTAKVTEEAAAENNVDPCSGLLNKGLSPINCSLQMLLEPLGFLLQVSSSLFVWAIDPAKMMPVIDSDGVKLAWKNVRDFLNIAFILFLLFSAFCTIFQVEKYSYKKIMLNLVLMALLVNFSFPIARFIIDVSNTLMYTMLNSLFPGDTYSSIFGQLTEMTNIGKIINPLRYAKDPDKTQLILTIVFLFVLGVTFLVMAVLFVIRVVALTILIIFSPIAFTGSIIPGIQDKAAGWWNELFSYSFFGPIMVFMIYLAVTIGKVSSESMSSTMPKIANANTTGGTETLVNLCIFVIPIILLWMGMGIAGKMSIAGAGTVVGFAQGKMQNMGKWFAGRPMWATKKAGQAAWWGAKRTGIPGGLKQRWDQSWLSKKSSDARLASKEARMAAKFGTKGAVERDMKTRAEEYKKNFESIDNLKNKAKKGDAAAAYRLALDGKADLDSYSGFINKAKDDQVKTIIKDKIAEKRIDIVIDHTVSISGGNRQNIAKDHLGKLSAEKWRDQNMTELLRHPENLAAAQDIYNTFDQTNQNKITENMSGKNYAAGKGHVWP